MQYKIEINGIDVEAHFTEDNIHNIFLPLLRRLTKLQRDKGGRVLAMISAPPGTGKSTLCAFLKYLSENTEGLKPIQIIGMDGFHRYQEYLTTHTTLRDGKEVTMVQIKGAPITFDLELLKERIKKIAEGEKCGWPTYNRMTHNPTENAILVNGDIVLLEGNYLLLAQDGWRDIKQYADFTIQISADENDLRKRLVDRKVKSGASLEEATAFVEYSDLYNVRTVLQESMKGDWNLRLLGDDSYEKIIDRKAFNAEPDIPDCGCIYG